MNFNLPKIDSLRLLIPIDEVTINPAHPEFNRHITTINEDGEILSETKNNAYRLHSNPCSCHYLRATTIIQGQAVEVIKLGFSSKTLKDKYFDGITIENLPDIYQFILSEAVISLSYESLLNAKVVDTDICTDIMLTGATVLDVVTIAYQLSEKHKDTTANLFKQKTNVGIEWSHRNKVGQAYASKQYLKYYAKALELKYKSKVFYDAYIKGTPVEKHLVNDKLIRIETTIKNNAHWLTYGTTVKTLQDLLKLDLTKYLDIYNRPINHYMQGAKPIKKREGITLTEQVFIDGIAFIMETKALGRYDAIDFKLSRLEFKTKFEKSKLKKRLTELMGSNYEELKKKFNKHQLSLFTELETTKLIPMFKQD